MLGLRFLHGTGFSVKTIEIELAHSPDADDAFMFYALATRKLRTGNLRFHHVLADIETLNRAAMDSESYDVSAVSFHAYAYLADRYLLLPCGASFGDGYGPVLVAARPLKPADVRGKTVAVPGTLTTAYLVLRLFEPEFEPRVVPFDQISKSVEDGEADLGLIIHEGQLTYAQQGLHRVADLGEWWRRETGLPLPLGGNVIRRALGQELIGRVAKLLRKSIEYALAHREAALHYALQFARGIDPHLADRFVGMYVNEWTLDYGERGRAALAALLERSHRAGLLPKAVEPEFAGESPSIRGRSASN